MSMGGLGALWGSQSGLRGPSGGIKSLRFRLFWRHHCKLTWSCFWWSVIHLFIVSWKLTILGGSYSASECPGASGGLSGAPTWFWVVNISSLYRYNWRSIPLWWTTSILNLLIDFWKMSHVPCKTATSNVPNLAWRALRWHQIVDISLALKA